MKQESSVKNVGVRVTISFTVEFQLRITCYVMESYMMVLVYALEVMGQMNMFIIVFLIVIGLVKFGI